MAPNRDPDVLVGVADAILEGTAVDWDSAEAWVDREHADLLPQLKIVSAVADLHRSIPDSSTAPRHWGHLRLLERIGEGAFGEVYRAWDTRLDREVALKLLPEGSASADARSTAIVEEGRLLARVRHPSVVTIYGAERTGGRVGLWMEFIKGRTLEQLVAGGRQFTAREVMDIGHELARAIGAVHAAGLLHRDIKAQNVMLADDGRVVLMDFGTGLEAMDSDRAAPAGTPRYLAPELFAGGTPTHASDLYGLGVLLFRLATGSYPVRAEDMVELRAAHGERARFLTRDVQRDVPRRLARVIDRLLDPDPARRGAGATDVENELAALRGTGKAKWLRVAAAVVTLAFAGGLLWLLRPTPPSIAVLPFTISGDFKDAQHFASGLADEIIHRLSEIEGLQVRSRTSAAAIKAQAGAKASIPVIGARLDAHYLIECSIVGAGSKLGVDVRLVRAADEVPLWGEHWDEADGDMRAIRDRIARAVATQLDLRIGPSARTFAGSRQAYEKYLTARGLVQERGEPNGRLAAALLEEVLRADQNFAPAWGLRALAYGHMSVSYEGVPYDDALTVMRASVDEALRVDPSAAEAHAARGMIRAREFNWPGAIESFERAMASDPRLTLAATDFVATTLIPLERANYAERVLATAKRHDPSSLEIDRELGTVYLASGRYAEAVTKYQFVLARDPAAVYARLNQAMVWAGAPEKAIRRWEDRPGLPGNNGYIAHALVRVGRRADAEALLPLTLTRGQPRAMVQTALGNLDGAFDALEQMMIQEPHRVPRLLAFPEMDILRGHPRLAELKKRLNLPQ